MRSHLLGIVRFDSHQRSRQKYFHPGCHLASHQERQDIFRHYTRQMVIQCQDNFRRYTRQLIQLRNSFRRCSRRFRH